MTVPAVVKGLLETAVAAAVNDGAALVPAADFERNACRFGQAEVHQLGAGLPSMMLPGFKSRCTMPVPDAPVPGRRKLDADCRILAYATAVLCSVGRPGSRPPELHDEVVLDAILLADVVEVQMWGD